MTQGWYVVGPMEFVCVRHAATQKQVEKLYRGRFVADIIKVSDATVHGQTCILCEEAHQPQASWWRAAIVPPPSGESRQHDSG